MAGAAALVLCQRNGDPKGLLSLDRVLSARDTASSPPPSSKALRRTGQPSPPEEEREKTRRRFGGSKCEIFQGILTSAPQRNFVSNVPAAASAEMAGPDVSRY